MKPAGLHADQGIGVFAGSAGFLFSRKREKVWTASGEPVGARHTGYSVVA